MRCDLTDTHTTHRVPSLCMHVKDQLYGFQEDGVAEAVTIAPEKCPAVHTRCDCTALHVLIYYLEINVYILLVEKEVICIVEGDKFV